MDTDEEIVHVFQTGTIWAVKPKLAKETTHNRKAVAALHAKQIANSRSRGRVIFHKQDGSVEVECVYESRSAHTL